MAIEWIRGICGGINSSTWPCRLVCVRASTIPGPCTFLEILSIPLLKDYVHSYRLWLLGWNEQEYSAQRLYSLQFLQFKSSLIFLLSSIPYAGRPDACQE